MIRKVVTAVILVPLTIIIVGFAVANRQAVTVSFDPFNSANPAYAATLPLFIIIFLLVILGVVIGGVAAWLRQGKWRHLARQAEATNRALIAENGQLRRQLDMSERQAAPARAERAPPLALRSPTN